MIPYSLQNNEIRIASRFELAGTLTIPIDAHLPAPAVLIIAGSGPTDRNGNPNRSVQLNIYKQLADILASSGFVVLRYDKRGCGQSKGAFIATGLTDLVDDALAAMTFLRNQETVDPKRIFVIGHSEGALIAPSLDGRTPIRGIVLLAGAAETLESTMIRQQKNAFSEIHALSGLKGTLLRLIIRLTGQEQQATKLVDKVKRSNQDVIRFMGVMKINAKWMREHFAYDVLRELAQVRCPVLAITGDRDIQVIPEHAEQLATSVKGDSSWHIVSGMNHILQPYEGHHTMLNLMREYLTNPKKQTHPKLIEVLMEWLTKHAATEGDHHGKTSAF